MRDDIAPVVWLHVKKTCDRLLQSNRNEAEFISLPENQACNCSTYEVLRSESDKPVSKLSQFSMQKTLKQLNGFPALGSAVGAKSEGGNLSFSRVTCKKLPMNSWKRARTNHSACHYHKVIQAGTQHFRFYNANLMYHFLSCHIFRYIRCLQIAIGETFKGKNMSTGDFLVKTEMQIQSRAPFAGKPVADYKDFVTPHPSLNAVRFVIFDTYLVDVPEQEVLEGFEQSRRNDSTTYHFLSEWKRKPHKTAESHF